MYGDSEFKWWTKRYKDAHGQGGRRLVRDFWPGEYEKTWTYVRGGGYQGLVAAVKSGDSFIVSGDLIDGLDFHAAAGTSTRDDGADAESSKRAAGSSSPSASRAAANNHADHVKPDHIDLIAGAVTHRHRRDESRV